MVTSFEIAFQIVRFPLRYRGIMSVWLKDRRRRIENVKKGFGEMQESLILGLVPKSALVDHQATIQGHRLGTSGLSVHHAIGLRAPSHTTPLVYQKCKQGRPGTQPWLLRVLVSHSILIELR